MSDKKISSQFGGAAFGDGATNNTAITNPRDVYITKHAPAPLPPPRQLRRPLDDFVGREEEISQLMDALCDGGRASISGMGGIGKTELALLVAGRLREDYPDAQLFIDLRGMAGESLSSIEALSRCIRSLIGPEAVLPDDPEELAALYRSCLSGKRALILLDNAADRNQILPLAPPAGCALLVTSREGISLPDMERLSLEQLKQEEARRLLLEIAPRISPEIADRIGYLCGYLPLAIRAAGSLLDMTIDLDPAQYAAQLSDERTRLENIGAEGVDIDVAASFNLSYKRLKPKGARVFRQLSIFVESFDAEAEEIICRDPGHKTLSDLVRQGLVLFEKGNRYRLLDLARVFAQGHLRKTEEEAGKQSHAMHYQRVLANADDLYRKGEEETKRGLALFDKERVNIEAGWKWTQEQVETNEEAARLCIDYPDAGAYVLDIRQRPRERIEWLEPMLTAARKLKKRDAEGRALSNLGLAYWALGDAPKAIDYQEQRLEIAREIKDRRGEGNSLGNLGLAYASLGETRKAIDYHKQQLQIAREVIDRPGEGNALDNLGIDYANLGEARKAIKYFKQKLEIVREIGDQRGKGSALGNLGLAYAELGETRIAIEYHDQNLELAREIGDRKGEAYSLHNKALAIDALGDRAQAIGLLESALKIYERIEDPQAYNAGKLLSQWRGEQVS